MESDSIRVLEYSETPKELAEKRSPNRKLLFRAGSIAQWLFTMDFLNKVSGESVRLPFHMAEKKIPFVDLNSNTMVNPSEINGIKLEKFLFDIFAHAEQTSLNM